MNSMKRHCACAVVLAFAAALPGGMTALRGAEPGAGGDGQIPSTFTNLQVLPKTISRPELIRTMRGIATDLGVRCATCHVGPDNLEGMDFASDEKRTKQVARTMLKMVQTINAEFVGTIPAGTSPRQTVTCATCHRGTTVPTRALDALLLETVAAGGVDAALDRHRQLRDELRDSGLYDFRERTLARVGNGLVEEKRLAEALVVFKRNAELFPASAAALVNVGSTAAMIGDSALAEESFRKALAIDPAHQGALRGLASIKR